MAFKKGLLLVMAVALVIVMAGCGKKENGNKENANKAADNNDKQTEQKVLSWPKMPEMAIDVEKTYLAKFKTTKGAFTVELFAKDAPQTVNSFVFLANEKFYDGIKFHRIVEDFMIQTGDPKADGTGGPGYNIPDELNNGHKYEDGVVAMANTGQPNTGGSQFFICTGPVAGGLNSQPNFTIFGKVKDGMDVVKKIAQTPVEANGREMSKPTEEVKIETIEIEVQ
ncbi:peptidylprolyl isomerase [Paenibacillus sp. GCM10027626]|uniref:peptidylprolyl isomerase n=1 Tax=Paenibacillus sp. GCM10027626 TaxID=3273411 RepID=UPI00362606E9